MRKLLLTYAFTLLSLGCVSSGINKYNDYKFDDIFLPINLKKEDVKDNSNHNLFSFSAFNEDDESAPERKNNSVRYFNALVDPIGAAVYIVTLAIAPAINKVLIGSRVFVYPEGYKKGYKQEVAWGPNKIRLPNKFVQNGGNLIFEVEGGREGKWLAPIGPSAPYINLNDSKP